MLRTMSQADWGSLWDSLLVIGYLSVLFRPSVHIKATNLYREIYSLKIPQARRPIKVALFVSGFEANHLIWLTAPEQTLYDLHPVCS